VGAGPGAREQITPCRLRPQWIGNREPFALTGSTGNSSYQSRASGIGRRSGRRRKCFNLARPRRFWRPYRVHWKLEHPNIRNYVEERDGGYYIAGTRISLDSIVYAFQDGESPDAILRSFPMAGPLVRIYRAITFYLEHKEKVEEYLKDQERRWETLPRERPKSDDPLINRLREAKGHAALRRS